MRRVLICPICQRHEFVQIPESMVMQRNALRSGLVPIIIKEAICDHHFIVYVDKQWKIRRVMPVPEDSPFPHMFALEKRRFAKEHLVLDVRKSISCK